LATELVREAARAREADCRRRLLLAVVDGLQPVAAASCLAQRLFLLLSAICKVYRGNSIGTTSVSQRVVYFNFRRFCDVSVSSSKTIKYS